MMTDNSARHSKARAPAQARTPAATGARPPDSIPPSLPESRAQPDETRRHASPATAWAEASRRSQIFSRASCVPPFAPGAEGSRVDAAPAAPSRRTSPSSLSPSPSSPRSSWRASRRSPAPPPPPPPPPTLRVPVDYDFTECPRELGDVCAGGDALMPEVFRGTRSGSSGPERRGRPVSPRLLFYSRRVRLCIRKLGSDVLLSSSQRDEHAVEVRVPGGRETTDAGRARRPLMGRTGTVLTV